MNTIEIKITIESSQKYNPIDFIKKIMDGVRDIAGEDFIVTLITDPKVKLKDYTRELPKSNFTIHSIA